MKDDSLTDYSFLALLAGSLVGLESYRAQGFMNAKTQIVFLMSSNTTMTFELSALFQFSQ